MKQPWPSTSYLLLSTFLSMSNAFPKLVWSLEPTRARADLQPWHLLLTFLVLQHAFLLDSACIPSTGCDTAYAFYRVQPTENLISVAFKFQTPEKLAIKRMNLQATREFLAELQVLTHVHHTNLVQLIGYCTTDYLFLICKFMENGTLDHHLHFAKGAKAPLSWSSKVQIALDAVRGLEYLHEHTRATYIHRDIKLANILLDKDVHAKVADFGLTKLTEIKVDGNLATISTRVVGT